MAKRRSAQVSSGVDDRIAAVAMPPETRGMSVIVHEIRICPTNVESDQVCSNVPVNLPATASAPF